MHKCSGTWLGYKMLGFFGHSARYHLKRTMLPKKLTSLHVYNQAHYFQSPSNLPSVLTHYGWSQRTVDTDCSLARQRGTWTIRHRCYRASLEASTSWCGDRESSHGTHTGSLVEWEGPSSAGTRYCLHHVLLCWVDKLSMSHPWLGRLTPSSVLD